MLWWTFCKKHYVPSFSESIKQLEEVKTEEKVMILSEKCKSPPRLLICYSSNDGPAHVNAVMKLGAFMQQHMATQVVHLAFC